MGSAAAKRRENVRRAKAVYDELGDIGNVLRDVEARIPALIRRIDRAREELDTALSGRASGDSEEVEERGAQAPADT